MNDELKYLDYFGLGYNPFPVAPDYERFFLSEHIDIMISEIVHGILTRKGFIVLTGEIGLGKTTISRKILGILEENNVETSLVVHTIYQNTELLREINRDFGLDAESLNLSDQMHLLNNFLIDQNKNGRNCAVIIDDAQNLSMDNLELIRMISNLDTDSNKLIQILLIGQPELMDKLDSPELSQFKSRIVIRKEAKPLTGSELKNYITFKFNMAGNQGKTTVTGGAFRKIYGYSRGNFRKINMLMDRCLYVAFLHNTADINRAVVNAAVKDIAGNGRSGKRSLRVVLSAAIILIFLICGGFYLELIPGIDYPSMKQFICNLTSTRNMAKEELKKSSPPARSEQTTVTEKTPAADSSGEKTIPDEPVSPEPPSVEAETADAGTAVPVSPEEKAVPEKPAIPAALSEFLAYSNLSDYAVDFLKAVNDERFKDLGDIIYEETGYQLIQSHQLPDTARKNYAIFSFVSKKTGKGLYSLFWKPTIRIQKFYPDYKGKEILKLEKRLGALKLYTYYLDGTVGSRLMKAVSYFQKEQGLQVTGFPDHNTIFLIYQGG